MAFVEVCNLPDGKFPLIRESLITLLRHIFHIARIDASNR